MYPNEEYIKKIKTALKDIAAIRLRIIVLAHDPASLGIDEKICPLDHNDTRLIKFLNPNYNSCIFCRKTLNQAHL